MPGHNAQNLYSGHNGMALYSYQQDPYCCLLEEELEMYIGSESGVEKYTKVQKLCPKHNQLSNYGYFLNILVIFWSNKDHFRGSTSHGSSGLIFMFL